MGTRQQHVPMPEVTHSGSDSSPHTVAIAGEGVKG
ncbi:hypothetical protein QF017_000950 [Pseudomonas laurylsulfatiphila]|jgi:hypothetical protein